ncbi:DUF6527 family protein [Rhizobium sp. 007]|uniref:DUF6527 family protein n=1 Tax=Rhizobium sp. 007 TaxID=2785056 RepID=UPI00188E5446|nr:DUF6527 family protein [Rhizobium sp. 007]QPB24581.1 hypothetical protein ISN39_34185 [Rhizobium sp. 007]
MDQPARKIRLQGEVEYRDESLELLKLPGDAAIVVRGQPRSFMLKCPDGCGETLAVNLDGRTDKAWILDMRGGEPTLFPSVWRDSGCKSHFVVWRGHVLWCDRWEDGNVEPAYDPALEDKIWKSLPDDRLKSAVEVAYELDEIPWDVSRVCRQLARCGKAEAGTGNRRDWFRRR